MVAEAAIGVFAPANKQSPYRQIEIIALAHEGDLLAFRLQEKTILLLLKIDVASVCGVVSNAYASRFHILPVSVNAEEIVVATWLENAHPRMVMFAYEIRTADDRKLASGFTKHVFCGRDMRPARLPEKYWEQFGITRTP